VYILPCKIVGFCRGTSALNLGLRLGLEWTTNLWRQPKKLNQALKEEKHGV